MKWLRTLIIFDKGNVLSTPSWKTLHESYVRSIRSIEHPVGTGKLCLRCKTKRPDGQWQRNGVGYLRLHFLEHMKNVEMWNPEGSVDLGRNQRQREFTLFPSLEQHQEEITSNFGGFDFVTTSPEGIRAAIEWETGNISSSHRSMNKLAIALESGIVQVGVLIVPSRDLYEHMTDRIGNIGELSGYLSMWESLKTGVSRGLLAISVVEHDELTENESFPYLSVGNDGNAKKSQSKKN